MPKVNIAASALLFVPIFVTYIPGRGFITSANPFNLFELPSVPLSVILLPFLALYFVKFRKIAIVLAVVLAATIYSVIIWQATGLYRQFFYVLSLALAMTAFYLGLAIFKDNEGLSTVSILKNILMSILLVKLLFDLATGSLMTDFFIISKLSIYNFYDYFPVVYFLLFALSFELFFRTSQYKHLLGVGIGLLVFLTWSRLFQLSVIIVFIYYLGLFYRINKHTQINLTLVCVLILMFYFALQYDPRNVGDRSLHERFTHWHEFLGSFRAIDLILPFLNSYRQELNNGTLHNEFLDVYSYFGPFTLIGFMAFYRGRSVRDRSGGRIVAVVSIVFILGSLVQNNITQFYSCILYFFIIGALNGHQNRVVVRKIG